MRYITSAVLRMRAQLDALLLVFGCYDLGLPARGWKSTQLLKNKLESGQLLNKHGPTLIWANTSRILFIYCTNKLGNRYSNPY